MTRALLILLITATAATAQSSKKQPNTPSAPAAPLTKRPEVSSAADFRPAELAKLAVVVTAGRSRHTLSGLNSTHVQRLVEDAFLECLLAKGYTVAARSDVDSMLREKSFEESGATEELAARVGKVLNVPAVMLLRVTEVSNDLRTQTSRASLGARLVNVETGAILWTGNHSYGGLAGRSGSGAVLLATATALAEAFPDKPRPAGDSPRLIDPKVVPKLAVLTVDGSERPTTSRSKRETPQGDRDRRVEDVFVQVLLQKGYKLVSRTDLQAVMKEQAFQKSGLTEDNAVAAGKLLNVPAMLLVGVTESASDSVTIPRGKTAVTAMLNRAAVGARLVDVASGEIRWVHAEYKFLVTANKADVSDLLAEVAKNVAQFLPPEPDSARGLLEQARLLELMGQVSAAKGKKAAARPKEPGK